MEKNALPACRVLCMMHRLYRRIKMTDDSRAIFRRGAAAGAFGGVLISIVIGAGLANGTFDGGLFGKGLPMRRIQEKMGTLQNVIDEYFLFEEDMEQVENSIYKGLMAGLNDPYSVYYTPEEFDLLMEESEGSYCGIGMQVTQDYNTGVLFIVRVFKGSPAEEAGLKKGDIIEQVDGVDVTSMDLEVLTREYIRGEEGSIADITVLRGGESITIPVERGMVEIDTVDYKLLEDKTGYILVTEFDGVTTEQFKSAVDELEEKGMKRLVIDLRNNPGGVLESAVDMAAYLLPEDKLDGTLVSTADKNGRGFRYFSKDGQICFEENDGGGTNYDYPKEDGHQLDLPVAVLMNGQSASASEMFAGALRDYEAAILVGTTSFGKGIMQSVLSLEDGSGVKVTVAHYFTPSGFKLHEIGLEPDVKVEMDEALYEEFYDEFEIPLDRDNQFLRAVEELKGKEE